MTASPTPTNPGFEITVDLCRLAMAIATPGAPELGAALKALAAREDLPPGLVSEAILQGIPYSGIPGAVEALMAWREGRSPSPPCVDPPHDAPGAGPGERLFDEVYGGQAGRVREELARSHPDLERSVIEFAYGTVMARGIFDLGTLEALGVASLLAQQRPLPLRSHIRGALRNGWEPEDLLRLLDRLAPAGDDRIFEKARQAVRELAGRTP